MIAVRKSEERGRADHGWLDTRHTFSFADYHDRAHMEFRDLRVLNEDRVAPAAGFPAHGHADMEILTVILEGALRHRDNLGTSSAIRPGEVQRMTAGTGVIHSEMNESRTDPVHFLQIWIKPERRGLTPGYEQKDFSKEKGPLVPVASRDGRGGSLTIHQDTTVYRARLAPGEEAVHELAPGRHAWVQVAGGEIEVNEMPLAAGDGAAISGEKSVRMRAKAGADALLFDLA
ncbi:MAG TPA: pirin family protein [Planctomycetota bacterium]|nr:pirin family protein [Planctomycetota bacterium]